MKKSFLMVRQSDSLIQGVMVLDDPDAGPVPLQAQAPEGFTLVEDSFGFKRAGHTDTEAAYLVDGAITWVETATLAQLGADAVVSIDAQADAARLSVSPAGRDLEYARAEAQAQAYTDAGYAGDAPSCVDSWARAKQWSSEDAAKDILSTAARWYSALDQIRDLRLNAKEAVRRASDPSGIQAIVTQFQTDLTNLMKGLQ